VTREDDTEDALECMQHEFGMTRREARDRLLRHTVTRREDGKLSFSYIVLTRSIKDAEMTTVMFGTSRGLLSRVIRWVTKSPASHALIGFEVEGVPCVLHATVGGVQISLRAKWERNAKVVAEYRTIVQPDIRHAVTHIGDHYDYVGLLGYVWVLAWRALKKRVKNPLASSRSVVCSEFLLHLNHDDAFPEWSDLDPETTTPRDLMERCERNISFRRLR